MTKKPHEDTRLAKFIERRVLELKAKKSQLQIANEAGFPKWAQFCTHGVVRCPLNQATSAKANCRHRRSSF